MNVAVEPKQGLLARIRWMSAYMNPALRRIAERVLRAPEDIKSISIKDLAMQCEVSESTVTRFVREIEVTSFQQFKILIAEELSQGTGVPPVVTDRHVYEDINENDDTASVLSKVAARYAMTIADTRAGLSSDELERAVSAIEQADMLAFFAMGASLICVENALLRFMRVGKPCQFFRDLGIRQISTSTLGPKSLAIGISNSGRTISTVDSLKEAKAQGAVTMCITSFPDSPLVRHADIRLFTPTVTGVIGPADYHESMVSKIAQLQIIDVLYSLYAVRNFGSAIAGLEKTSDVTSLTRY
ncbi:MurR/RpiR family transcriptional regulator [Neotabrizicola sp. VNH66]|uniref:MurR/RpiR family transcriptional regulator n=1 Tax=Neotabrizicola sp. VNH66 TaxID=3400918 RepID=UPI003BFCF2FB